MSSIARDIKRTLFIKCLLLFALWFLCFRGVEKPTVTINEWILGPTSVQGDTILSEEFYSSFNKIGAL